VERTFSWLGKCRRLAVDYERKPEHHQAWVQWAMVRVMVKRLARQAPPSPPERSAWPHDLIRTGSKTAVSLWGWSGRIRAMTSLADDLVPDEL
jgi:hypothetical protein